MQTLVHYKVNKGQFMIIKELCNDNYAFLKQNGKLSNGVKPSI